MQVLKGLGSEEWKRIKQLVVEVHSSELLVTVRVMVSPHFDRVSVEQDASLVGSELFLLRAWRA